ncbi:MULTISPECIES: Crp/Fnr family transcriptional regulator [Olivibacter]|uniref:Crp/Fnr family transcriptional regulator n=1 Tax=Olivibacter jilunii TaxID=985016 RepID=A0ABW6B6I3_9SPHI|nr:Crp/Fnr family transcriptional regulator [Pseudosphingobacterium sp.]
MLESLAAYLAERGDLNNEEIKRVEGVVVPKKLRKRQYLLQEGDISFYNSFIAKGCLRLYQVGRDGSEHILRFAIENWWISDYESYNSGLPSKYNIEALEDSLLLMIHRDKFEELVETIPAFKKLRETLDAKNFEVNQKRILSNISETAEEKYDNFIQSCPQIYSRVPLHMIASFLGVSRETLSRVRQQYAKNSTNK